MRRRASGRVWVAQVEPSSTVRRVIYEQLDDEDRDVLLLLGYTVGRAQLLEYALLKLLEAQRFDLDADPDERCTGWATARASAQIPPGTRNTRASARATLTMPSEPSLEGLARPATPEGRESGNLRRPGSRLEPRH